MSNRKAARAVSVASLIAALALGAGIVSTTLAGSDQAGAGVQSPGACEDGRSSGPDELSMEAVLARLADEGYRDVTEIEREHGRYEVEARDAEGRRVELHLDARTGDVLKRELED